MKRILIDNKQEDLKKIAYSIPWKSDTVCFNFKHPEIFVLDSEIEELQDEGSVETLVIGCKLVDYSFISKMNNLRQLYIYSGDNIYDLNFIENLVCLQQICICNSHVESIQPIANLIKNKKEKHTNSKEFKEKLECDIEGIYIETDRCSVNEEELDFSGIYIGEIKIRKMK